MKTKNNEKKEILITYSNLPLFCPLKQTWDAHPKIYLDIKSEKKIICPYCGTKYKLST